MSAWKGTPGPWRADRNHGCRLITAKVGPQHRQAKRTEVACTPGLYDDDEDQRNANGMAAVPQLVEALAELLGDVRTPGLYRFEQEDIDMMLDALKAAGADL